MMIELLVACGATVGDLIQHHRGEAGARPRFEKIMLNDPRGAYGEYLIWLEQAEAEIVLSRYPTVARKTDGET